MKLIFTKRTYFLIFFSLVLSLLLQLAWLQQLYVSQERQLKEELEQAVREASKSAIFQAVSSMGRQAPQTQDFFLSPQWLQLRHAFDDLKVAGMQTSFQYGLSQTGAQIVIKFIMGETNAQPVKKDSVLPELPASIALAERIALGYMDSTVKKRVSDLGVTAQTAFALHDYQRDTVVQQPLTPAQYEKAAYKSEAYSYNLQHLNKYQVIIPTLRKDILYQMRYQLIASFLILAITGVTFYVLLHLMRQQYLYTTAKLSFTRNMTHEFKSPITTVSTALESIVRYDLGKNPDKLQNYVRICRGELARLNLMMDKILNLNLLDSKKDFLTKEHFDLQEGIQQAISHLNVQLEAANANIQFQPAPESLYVLGDPLHLTNVFYNLIENAVKYSVGQPHISISCKQEKDKITVTLADNGIGIETMYHDKIFEQFFRVSSPNIHTTKGSGLGLYYVREIMVRHKGHIQVKSKPGNGSVFTLILPTA